MLGMEDKELYNSIEALLFVAGDPVSTDKLAEALGIPMDELEAFMPKMLDEYNYERRGIKLIKLENSYQLTTRSEYFDAVVRMVTHKQKQVLSPATLEVLSIISYNQPITKAAIEKVRGVDSSHSLAKLLERELIEQRGRLNAPGRPVLYGTTDEFLRCFGLTSLDEMPNLNDDLSELGMETDPNKDNVTFDELEKRMEDGEYEEVTDPSFI
ncbi:MAG: SMC-Scp complex subunit ScpB [Clostridia bacterium]|nr:SMC-Scp complex subunit ScpB [Oscillospiraceae bacterium]MBR4892386.1 SMC-Scp complex subunit ScpB [Clostridia bacterium]